MNKFFALCVVVLVVSEANAASIRVRRQVIPREFQNVNIENYLKNERAVRFQLKCIIDDGPCDRIGKYLKVTIPELLVNQCANCDSAQRERAGKLVSHIQQHYPEEWERAVKKFQGGLVKPEDAARLENILGVRLDPKLVGSTTTAAPAPAPTTPAAKPVEVPSTSEVPVSTSSTTAAAAAASPSSTTVAAVTSAPSAQPEVTSAATSAAPVESTSVAAAVASSSTAAAVAPTSTSESAAVVTSSTSEAAPSSTTAAAVAPSSSSAAPTA